MNFEEFKARYQKVPVEEYPNRVVESVPEPMVSVQVSTYQHADFIRDCLDGILMQQTTFPIEILIGEDESSDGTREICMEYADRHPEKIRLFLHRRENNIRVDGQPSGKFTWAYSMYMCRGRYIAHCEGDDYWTDPKKLQKQVDFLEANPEFVVSCHDARVVDASGHLVKESKLPDSLKRDFTGEEMMAGAWLLTMSLCHRNVLDGFPPEYFKVLNGDTFIISLLGQHGKAKYQEDIEPAVYREHEGGIWSTKQDHERKRARANTFLNLYNYYESTGVEAPKDDLLISFMDNKRVSLRYHALNRNLPAYLEEALDAIKFFKENGGPTQAKWLLRQVARDGLRFVLAR